MLYRTLILLLLASSTLTACTTLALQGELGDETLAQTQTIRNEVFPWQGERASFDVSISVGGLKGKALTLSVAAGHPQVADDGTPFIELHGDVTNIPGTTIAHFFKVDDVAKTFIDPTSWLPFYAYKDLKENDRHRTYKVHYWLDERHGTSDKHYKSKKTKGQYKTLLRRHSLNRVTYDALSFSFAFRVIPLEPGTQRSWYVYDGWKVNRVTMIVQEDEKVWTPLGFYECMRLDIYRETLLTYEPKGALAGLFIDGESAVKKPNYFAGNVWLTKDTRRLPVRMVLTTSLADVDMVISSYRPPAPPSP